MGKSLKKIFKQYQESERERLIRVMNILKLTEEISLPVGFRIKCLKEVNYHPKAMGLAITNLSENIIERILMLAKQEVSEGDFLRIVAVVFVTKSEKKTLTENFEIRCIEMANSHPKIVKLALEGLDNQEVKEEILRMSKKIYYVNFPTE